MGHSFGAVQRSESHSAASATNCLCSESFSASGDGSGVGFGVSGMAVTLIPAPGLHRVHQTPLPPLFRQTLLTQPCPFRPLDEIRKLRLGGFDEKDAVSDETV